VTVTAVLLLLLTMNAQPTVTDDGDDDDAFFQDVEFDELALNGVVDDVTDTEETVNFIRKDVVADANNLSSKLDEILHLVRNNANDIKVIKDDLTKMKNFLGFPQPPPPLDRSATDRRNVCEY